MNTGANSYAVCGNDLSVDEIRNNLKKSIEANHNKYSQVDGDANLNIDLIDVTYQDVGKSYIASPSTKNNKLVLSPNSPFSHHQKRN